MNKFTNEELLSEIRELDIRYISKPKTLSDGSQVESVENFGGEGQGDEYWTVFKLTKDGAESFWKIPGWYQSFQGGELEWSDVYQVESYERMVTDWREVG